MSSENQVEVAVQENEPQEKDRSEVTSPGHLQDVTMDSSYALGYRSPNMSLQHGGNASPGQGRSVREFEEQMASLRNENFNLKLRLYFLEQKIPGYSSAANSSSDGHESLLKQNVDLKVDIEVLKREMQQKQSLLCEAAKAMELMEEQQKENDEKSRAIIEDLNQKIQYLEEENQQFERTSSQQNMDQLMGRSDLLGDVDILQKVRELEGQVKHYEEKTEDLINKQNELEQQILFKEDSLQERENNIKQMEFQIAELQEQLDEKAKEAANLEKKYEERTRKLASDKDTEAMRLASENKCLQSSIEKLKAELERDRNSFEDRNKKLKEQQHLMEEMQLTIISKKNNTIKLSKTIEEYERALNDLRAEQRILARENRNLKEIIVKLEETKLKDMQSAQNLEIYLGKHMIAGNKDNRQVERRRLLPITHENDLHPDHQKLSPSKNFLVNPLFRQMSSDFENIGDTGSCRTSDLKLKEKICYNSIKTINTQAFLYDPGFYVRETKNYHSGGSLNGMKQNAGSRNMFKEDNEGKKLTSNIERAIKSLKKSSPALQNMKGGDAHQNRSSLSVNQSESSETSLMSCMSHAIPETSNNNALKIDDEVAPSHIEKCNAGTKNPKLKEELLEYKTQLANKTCELNDTQERLEEKTMLYEKSCKAIQKLMLNVKELQSELDRLKRTKGSHNITNLKESQEFGPTYEKDSTAFCEDKFNMTLAAKQKMEAILIEKDAEIMRLKEEVKKKTANLQNLINKELWEKNREIERLTKLTNGRIPGSPVHDVDPLQQSFSDSDYVRALEQNKRLQSKVDYLIQKLYVANDRNTQDSVQQLKNQIRDAREDAERAECWRKECAELCSVLTVRLEELAGFLDSLLRHKDILGALGADRRKAMRKAVDRSLELSRSLNSMSLSYSGASVGDNTLDLLGNITNILDHTSDKENRTFNMPNDTFYLGSNQVIENLKAEVKALKKELDKKKTPESVKKERRSLPLRLDNQSESEAWSEPDRNVSLARMGLEESLGMKIVAKANEDPNGNTSSDSAGDQSRKCKTKNHDRITLLEQTILQKENKILKSQCELVDADNRLKQETLRRLEACQELEECRKLNAKLESEIVNFKAELSRYEMSSNTIESYKKDIEEKQSALERVSQLRDQLAVDIRVAEMEIQSLKAEREALQGKHEQDIEETRAQEQKKVTAIEIELAQKYEDKLRQVENNHKEYLARDWISRVIYEQTKRELEDAQKKLTEAQFTIDFLHENESELNTQLIENEKLRRSLKQSLDEATLQSSKIIVERTKAITEKLQVEAQLQQLMSELEEMKRERNDAIEQNNILNNQMMNAKAEIKKAVKQTSNGSDPSQSGSGYTSEEAIVGCMSRRERNVMQRFDNSSPDLGIESDAGRTSSTDQAGNNVKSHGVILRPKPELHHMNIVDEASQELSSTTIDSQPKENAHNDTTNNNDGPMLGGVSSTTSHDCAKVDQELAELRRKVIRQKRALEKTWDSLRASNQRKEQIERDIRQQIMKTQSVLKSVRTNMESELSKPRSDVSQQLTRDTNQPEVELN